MFNIFWFNNQKNVYNISNEREKYFQSKYIPNLNMFDKVQKYELVKIELNLFKIVKIIFYSNKFIKLQMSYQNDHWDKCKPM